MNIVSKKEYQKGKKFEVGVTGKGKYSPTTHQKAYQVWYAMIKRCYNNDIKGRQRFESFNSYVDTTVCEEWHSFQTFGEWFDENYYELGGERVDLDKDVLSYILNIDNKIYSPDTCMFLPQRINTAVRLGEKGYYFEKNGRIRMCVGCLGYRMKTTCKSVEDAQRQYLEYKKNYIMGISNKYVDKIPRDVYNKLNVFADLLSDNIFIS